MAEEAGSGNGRISVGMSFGLRSEQIPCGILGEPVTVAFFDLSVIRRGSPEEPGRPGTTEAGHCTGMRRCLGDPEAEYMRRDRLEAVGCPLTTMPYLVFYDELPEDQK